MRLNDKELVDYWESYGFDGPAGEEKRVKWDRLIELAKKGLTPSIAFSPKFHGPNCPCTMCT